MALDNGRLNEESSSSSKRVAPTIGSNLNMPTRPRIHYYIDELGFYRHRYSDSSQYICSNTSAINIIENEMLVHEVHQQQQQQQQQATVSTSKRKQPSQPAIADVCELSLEKTRRELGMTRFDRIHGYADWKSSWDKYINSKLTASQPIIFNRELRERVRSGIPHDYRYKVWSALIWMRTSKIRANHGSNIYEKLLRNKITEKLPANDSGKKQALKVNAFSSIDSSSTPPESPIIKHFRQIEMDLLRTLPNNKYFANPNSNGVKRVRRVLRAYAHFNPQVGYCQGMNRLAAMALLVLPEEEAFWCLVAIIHSLMSEEYYLKPWLAQVDCAVLNELLKKKVPKLHKHLQSRDIQLNVFTWFFTIFVDGFQPELMFRVWDCFLLDGDKVLFRIALAILHICQDELLKLNDWSSMNSYLSRFTSTRELDIEHVFDTFGAMNPLPMSTIKLWRQIHRDKIEQTIENRQ